MNKISLFSEKLGKTITIQSSRGMVGEKISETKDSGVVMMGWMRTGWSKSSSWNMP